jgi:hypothetical protein
VTSSDSDDDREDDPGLRSMRAVWLSMRDEEPPSSGLASLLAAARAKAVEMQPKEPWWRRAMASLRRPPVLALATVVVLLGGAVLISSRREAMDAMPRVEQEQLATNRAGGASQPEASATLEREGVNAMTPSLAKDNPALVADPSATEGAAPGPTAPVHAVSGGTAPAPADPGPSGGPRGKDLKTPASSGTAAPGGEAARPAGPAAVTQPTATGVAPETKNESVVVPEQPVAAPPPPPPPQPVVTGRRLDSAGAPSPSTLDRGAAGDKLKSPPPAVTVPAPTTPPKGVARVPKQDLQIAGDADAAVNSEVQVTGSSMRGKSFGADEERGGSKAVRGPTVGQLAKQAETAAARGDCAAVRAIMGRIKKLDATFHKEHVQNNAAVKRCVK